MSGALSEHLVDAMAMLPPAWGAKYQEQEKEEQDWGKPWRDLHLQDPQHTMAMLRQEAMGYHG